jgi:hypothetical protein
MDQRHPTPAGGASQLALTTVVFALAYTLCNHYTGTRPDVGAAIFEWERAIPFVPFTIVPYLSIVLFFVASFFVGGGGPALRGHVSRLLVDLGLSLCCYLLFPLRFQFDRPAVEGLCGVLFELLAACDLPYNRAPSLHISVLLLLWLRLAPLAPGGAARVALQVWFGLIGISVLTTWQHHLIDVPAGLAAGALSAWLGTRLATAWPGRRIPARPPRARLSAMDPQELS